MANPTLLDMPIARDGNKNAIPTTDNGTTGLLSQQYGWQLINAIPPQQGGKAVKREDFNGALYLLSNLLFYLQKGWQFEWDANQNYYAGCIVKDPNNGKMYQRLNDGTSTTAPHSDTTNWKLWDLSMLANYLPLAGGQMTGAIKGSGSMGGLNMYAQNDTTTGARLLLEDEDFGGAGSTTAGMFSLAARENNKHAELKGYSNGTLIWAENDLGGSAIVASSLGANGYVKNAKGLIVQWGRAYFNVGATVSDQISFPISFTTQRSMAICPMTIGRYAWVESGGSALDKFTIGVNVAQGYQTWVDWIAIGR